MRHFPFVMPAPRLSLSAGLVRASGSPSKGVRSRRAGPRKEPSRNSASIPKLATCTMAPLRRDQDGCVKATLTNDGRQGNFDKLTERAGLMQKSNPKPQSSGVADDLSAVLHCSFCGRDNVSVGKLIAGPGAYICDGCVAECNRIIERENGERGCRAEDDGRDRGEVAGPAVFGVWERLPNATLLRAASRTDRTLQELKAVAKAQIDVLRSRGVAWSKIGDALGTSRQAVWERFGKS